MQAQLRGDVGHLREEGRRTGEEVNDLKQPLEALRSDIKYLQERTGEQETKRADLANKQEQSRREVSKQLEDLRRDFGEQTTNAGRAIEMLKANNQLEGQKREELATRLGGAEERINAHAELGNDLRLHLEEIRSVGESQAKQMSFLNDLLRLCPRPLPIDLTSSFVTLRIHMTMSCDQYPLLSPL